MSRRQLERRLRSVRVPRESISEESAWRLARAAYAAREPVARRSRRAALALVPATAAVLAALLVLTPAGATVRRWITATLGVKHARPALLSLPAAGSILVVGPSGTWTVDQNGLRRRLGPWRSATWSPHALYVAGTGADLLTAVDRRGVTQWSLARPGAAAPRWFGPDGYRLAYLSGATLRVVAGDGTGDTVLARVAPRVAPAWQPGHEYVLAYASPDGEVVVVRDTATGRIRWTHAFGTGVRELAWSGDGSRLLVLEDQRAVVLDAGGRMLARLWGTGGALQAATMSPDGKTVALLARDGVSVATVAGGDRRDVFRGQGLRGITFSPDGRWLLVGWPGSDQWVFVHAIGSPRVIAVSRIAEQFGGHRAFPVVEGWCCTGAGGTP